MTHFGLFEGIGGFSLAAREMGWETVAWCEWNEFGQKILRYYFPEAEGFGDITKTDFTKYANKIDILTGGFPCQPYSAAGKRLGTEDNRHLWPEMLRAIREIQPRWVVGENVRGLTNWNGGVVFDEVQADLEAAGYEVLPFLLPACAVNAPHRRDRIWFIAYNNSNGQQSRKGYGERKNSGEQGSERIGKRFFNKDFSNGCNGIATNSISKRAGSKNGKISNEGGGTGEDWGESIRQTHGQAGTSGIDTASANGITTDTDSRRQPGQEYRETEPGWATKESVSGYWENFPTQSPLCIGNDGISARLDGITFSKWRNESIKAYGNAIVPQVAFEIFKAIAAM